MEVFVLDIDATAASVVAAFMDNKIMFETRSQVPEIDMINVINLFINKNLKSLSSYLHYPSISY